MARRKLFLCVAWVILLAYTVGYGLVLVGPLSPRVSLGESEKLGVALFLTLCLAGLVLPVVSAVQGLHRYLCAALAVSSAAILASAAVPPLVLGSFDAGLTLLGIASAALYGALCASLRVGVRLPSWSPIEVATVSVFSALTAVLTGVVGAAFPSPTGGYTDIGDAGIFIAALLFGPKVGCAVGVIGPLIADLLLGYPRWFVSVLAHGVEGVIAGLGRSRGLPARAALLALAGLFMASTYFVVNVYIKGYGPAVVSFVRDLFGQAVVSLVISLVVCSAVEKALPSLSRWR